MTDSRLLAEARIIARKDVNKLAGRLSVRGVSVYRNAEELSVGSDLLGRDIDNLKRSMSAFGDGARKFGEKISEFNNYMAREDYV